MPDDELQIEIYEVGQRDAEDEGVVMDAGPVALRDLLPAGPADDEDHQLPNPYYAAIAREQRLLAQQRDAQGAIEHGIGRLVEIQSERPEDHVSPALWAIERKLEKIDTTLGKFDRDDIDYVAALYAAAVDTSGVIVKNNAIGKWIVDAWLDAKPKSARLWRVDPGICDIATLDGKNAASLGSFIAALDVLRPMASPLAAALEIRDFQRFVRLAKGVCEVIGSPPDAAGPADDQSPAT